MQQRAGHPGITEDLRGAVDGVALADGADVQLHAGDVEADGLPRLVEGHVRVPAARGGLLQRVVAYVQAVDNVSFEIPKGTTGKLQRIGLAQKLGLG